VHQHGVGAGVGQVERAGVAHGGAGQLRRAGLGGQLARLLDVARDDVNQAHGVAQLGQPKGIRPRGAAHVEHRCGGRRQVSLDQLASAGLLQRTDVVAQALALVYDVSVIYTTGLSGRMMRWWTCSPSVAAPLVAREA
jgi:hypothetical protein